MRKIPPTHLRIASAAMVMALSLLPGWAQADYFVESPNCDAPVKPLEFVTELDKQEFDKKVNAYRGCLEQFVSKHNGAMEKHKQSADKAVAEWENYATQVLGVKLNKPEAGASNNEPAVAPAQ